MKTLFVLFTLFLSITQASAYEGRPVASLADVNREISDITLDENGLMTVTFRHTQDVAAQQLSKENTQRLTWLADALSEAALVTEHHDIICMMMVRYRPTLSVAGPSGSGRVVLSPQSCALPDYTHPTDESALQEALELKTSLIVLASQLKLAH